LYFYNDTKTFALIYLNHHLLLSFYTQSNYGKIIFIVLQDISTLIRSHKKFKICCFPLYFLAPATGYFGWKNSAFLIGKTYISIIIEVSILIKLHKL